MRHEPRFWRGSARVALPKFSHLLAEILRDLELLRVLLEYAVLFTVCYDDWACEEACKRPLMDFDLGGFRKKLDLLAAASSGTTSEMLLRLQLNILALRLGVAKAGAENEEAVLLARTDGRKILTMLDGIEELALNMKVRRG